MNFDLKITKIREVKTPNRANRTDGGIDFYIPEDFETIILKPGESINIPSGIKMYFPEGYILKFENKSGIAAKRSLFVGACVVDSDYRGEVHLDIHNVGTTEQELKPGDKITQGIVYPVNLCGVEEVSNEVYDSFGMTERGTGGFGSTGTN